MAIMESSAISLFSTSITEETELKMKQGDSCIVEAEDRIPRMISDCSYNVKQPSIEKHQLK